MSAVKKLNSAIYTGEGLAPVNVISLVLDNGYEQVLQSGHPFNTAEANTAALLAANPSAFFEHPVSAIFSPESVSKQADSLFTVYKRRFTEAQEKGEMIRQIGHMLGENVKSTSLRADIMTISDELITNAVFNAPFVDGENSRSGASREDRSVRMHEGMFGEISIARDQNRLLVVCLDSYGTLNPQKMLSRVRNCYDKGVAANINMTGGGGAGIGSYMIFNSSISFFVAVRPGKCTAVGCVLPLKGSGRTRDTTQKNLHYIFLK